MPAALGIGDSGGAASGAVRAMRALRMVARCNKRRGREPRLQGSRGWELLRRESHEALGSSERGEGSRKWARACLQNALGEFGRLVGEAGASQGEDRRKFRRQACKCRRIVRINAKRISIIGGRCCPEPNRVRWPTDSGHPIVDSERVLAT